ncbi:hypothetical protein [Spiroplasma apis]|uniref:Transmembrane protein n=1 Tax=Spiroplasma apis B31 TaxID=1276258 RepID=V5RHH1_SPIAP|nr:hypothetical protein [Spiroplasma apis]AHB36117.1 hypothetical protein SAPIS_v1c02710 [Spiroplasma apis B31]
MILASATWGTDGSLKENNLLILLVVLLLSIIIPAACSYIYMYKFTKNQNKKLINKISLFTILGMQALSFVAVILGMLFYFGQFFLEENPDLARVLTITFIAIAFVMCGVWYFLLGFMPQNIWIIFEEDQIMFMGESIKYSKINNIISDTKSSKFFINYLEGTKSLKKVKLSKNSVLGQFFAQNVELTGHKVEEMSQQEYFAKRLKEIKLVATDISTPSKATKKETPSNDVKENGIKNDNISSNEAEVKETTKNNE